MKKNLKILTLITLILDIFSTCALIYNYFAFEILRPKMINFEELGLDENYVYGIGIGFIIAFLFHFSAFFTSFFRFQHLKKATLLGTIALFLGVISFICIVGDLSLLNDIGKEYRFGLETNSEWRILYLVLIPHSLFHIMMFILLRQTFIDLKNPVPENSVVKDEVIFNMAQYIGIICGVIGLGFTFALLFIPIQVWMIKYLILIYCPFFIFPYGLIVFYWLLIKRKEKIREWYDEKQWQDVTRAAWITLLISIPSMGFMYMLNLQQAITPANILWFPFYLFLILFLFSGSILYFEKRG